MGYQPIQPIDFSHKLHASDLGIDCMFCHNMAESTAQAGVPPTQTCMNCHEQQANKQRPTLARLMRSWDDGGAEGLPIPWVRIHKVPDYGYFDHSAHISAGVGCKSCHGDVQKMEVISQREPLSMGWCLSCHRDPKDHLRPVHEVTNMDYHQSESFKMMAIKRAESLNAPVLNCSGCHR